MLAHALAKFTVMEPSEFSKHDYMHAHDAVTNRNRQSNLQQEPVKMQGMSYRSTHKPCLAHRRAHTNAAHKMHLELFFSTVQTQ